MEKSYLAMWMWLCEGKLEKWKKLTSGCRPRRRNARAVLMLPNRSQMTSKCGKSKNVAHESIAECVTDVLYLPHFDVFCDLFNK